MVLGELAIHMQKDESRPYLSLCTKIYSKWTKDLYVRFETTTGKNRENT
jgi:hypothetical protein